MSKVSTGAASLDKANRNWFKRIKRPIRMDSYTDCTLAQIYGDLDAGVKKLHLSPLQQIALGFHTDQLGNRQQADKLSKEWQHEVDRRVAKALKKKEPAVAVA